MIESREGTVKKIMRDLPDVQEIEVEVGREQAKAVCYPPLTGPVAVGDRVLLNTTAVRLELGSGGRHFVMANLSRPERELGAGAGHIMKLRYTPMQARVLSAEEEGSPHREAIESFSNLGGAPVVIGALHSMVAPVCASIKWIRPATRIVYVMTDGASLPIAFSKTVRDLKERKIIEATVTSGNAFGGDVETVTKHSALAAARAALAADVIMVAMGVGIVGTGTRLGNAGVEVGEWVNAAAALKGEPVVVPRMSFADPRSRHIGLSHHTVTALNEVALARANVAMPELAPEQKQIVLDQIAASRIKERHAIIETDGTVVFEAMREFGIRVTTMGRGPEDDPVFFLACGAAARVVSIIARADHN